MRSSYPSSQSFFDSTSDSIRAEDVEKCRNSASFSSLADLFTNPSSRSDLFPNSRAPVFVLQEVCFPEKKKRECEEKTSIWHEWGSGECQSENVAEESSGFTSDSIGGGKSSISSSSSFPNLGSANISLSTEEFTFPSRKKRAEGSSWREERASWQDWTTSVAPKRQEPTVTGSTPVVGSIQDMYLSKPCTKPSDFLTSSKSSPFSSLGAPAKTFSEEVSFPARKKREERSFWQESTSDGSNQSDCKVMATSRDGAPGVGSLADMYMRKAGGALFSTGAVSGTDEVVFPKRRNNADRNAWRDWANTGYGDHDHGTDQDSIYVDNSCQITSSFATETDGVAYPRVYSQGSIVTGRFSVPDNSPATECVLELPVYGAGVGAVGAMQASSSQVQLCEKLSVLSNGPAGNVDEAGCPDYQVGRKMDGGEASNGVDDSQSTYKYPPPFRSLSRQGQIRVPNHMPWVQLQPFRSNGRFVLREGKITQPVVFQPIRKGGRLVLELIGQEKKIQEGDPGARHLRNGLVAGKKALLAPERKGVNELEAVKAEATVVVEKTDVSQSLDNARKTEETRIRKDSKVRPALGTHPESERNKKSAKVWPVVCTPWEALPVEEVLFSRTEEAAADPWDRRSFNFRELCYMLEEIIPSSDRRGSEMERTASLDGGSILDRPPPWLLGKLSPEGRNFDVGKSLQTVTQICNAVDRLVQKGNVITIPRVGENAPLRLHFQHLPRTSSLRTGLSGLSCPRVDGGTLIRGKSMKSSSLPDVAALDSRKEESTVDSARGRAQDLRPSLSVYQGIIRDSFLSLATAHSFLRSLRTRPDIPGEHDPRVLNCKLPVASVFSCADGVGKRHHENNFWEQQPCVS